MVIDLVVASAGDDKKISLWRKNGQSLGTIPVAGSDIGDNIEVFFWRSVLHLCHTKELHFNCFWPKFCL